MARPRVALAADGSHLATDVAATSPIRPVPPLPFGFKVELDQDTKLLDDRTLFGGSPMRVMRLSDAGCQAFSELREGPIRSAAGAKLARRLTDAGAAHPLPPAFPGTLDITIIVPVHDRVAMLNRCLTALGSRYPVVVVDDASTDPDALAEVAHAHNARLIRRLHNGGPGAARNTGLAAIDSEFVAFLDSDCVPPGDWLEQLAAHLSDPLVAAVAPRIVPLAVHGSAGRYGEANGSLDLGSRGARVAPTTRVSYVPTAALLVRRAALLMLNGPFDESLRVGEDVDLIWRLHESGWRIRYLPSVRVRHQEPERWSRLLARRFSYGTSAAPLARRHPDAIAPLILHLWPTVTVVGLLGRRPLLAAAGFACSVLTTGNTLHKSGITSRGTAAAMATATRQTWLGLGKYATQFALPALVLGLVRPGSSGRTKLGRRLALSSLLLGPALTSWQQKRPQLSMPGFVAGQLADDLAYGAGVIAGSARTPSLVALRPKLVWRPTFQRSKPAPVRR